MLKLSTNRYRKLSYISCIIFSKIFDKLYNEKAFCFSFSRFHKLIKFFPYFLNEPCSNIKLKYLSLLLEELIVLCGDENEKEKNKEDNNDGNEEYNI